MSGTTYKPLKKQKYLAAFIALTALTGCGDAGGFAFGGSADTPPANSATAQSVQLIERDVEAPEVFQVTENGLWDGRPSLGGVWVAHPDVTDPERVIIRNPANDKFVIGALFRRERENPGPRLQVSSDAAATLGMLAGAPASLNVTALRREETTEAPTAEAVATFDAPDDIAATPLDPIAGAAAAIDSAETAMSDMTPTASPAPVAAPSTPRPTSSPLSKPYIQIGIFSVEANADRTADRMRATGIVPTVLQQDGQGRPFWRVIVGPAQTEAERARILEQVKAQGFADAYFVTN